MRKLISVLFIALGFIAGGARASTTAPVAGTDYKVLGTPVMVGAAVPGKIEVTEFFWYGCPHCNEFEPFLEGWIKKQNPDVVFRRVPVAFTDQFVPHQKLYHALEEMGLAEQMTSKIFNEIHVKKDYLLTPQAQADFLAKNGVDRQKFLAAYNSFSADAQVKRDDKEIADAKIDGVPTLLVAGKYETGPGLTNSLAGTLQVLDFLVSQVRAKKL
jgi:thiol:disulfide interchange protein DsbA